MFAVFIVDGIGFRQWADEFGPRVWDCREAAEERARAELTNGRAVFVGEMAQAG